MSGGEDRYAFGRDDPAARRLALLARVFDPTTEALVDAAARHAPEGPALDLGCGPGHTTRLLCDALARLGRRTPVLGLDAAEAFLAEAAERAPEARFAAGDVTAPLPGPPPALALARLLLAHLAEPLRAVEGWAAQLAPGGVLALEEVEAIRASEPIFADYLALQARLLAARGHDLYLGARLRELSGPSVRQSRAVSVSPAAGEAAAMFALNFTHWRRDPWTLANATPAELERLSAGLESLLGDPTHGRITWTMRQVILQPR